MQKLKVNAGKFLGANHQVRLQKAQPQNKEEGFQDGDFTQKAHQYLSSPDVLENTLLRIHTCRPPLSVYDVRVRGICVGHQPGSLGET